MMKKHFLFSILAAVLCLMLSPGAVRAGANPLAGTWTLAPKTKTVNRAIPKAAFKAKTLVKIAPDGQASLSFNTWKKHRKMRRTYKGKIKIKQNHQAEVSGKALKRFHVKALTAHYKVSPRRLTLKSSGEAVTLIRKTQN
ncbi:MAG: hypothetical protein DUD26_03325 [Eubacteriaceae bacterium]|jgi:hypothetical protein|nr:MAG: hypothetical protein DUD26_03325 [Eubacteriaceae bacterium]